jgi:hypothetical protein
LEKEDAATGDEIARLNRRLLVLTAQILAATRAIQSQSVLIDTMNREGQPDLADQATGLRDVILELRMKFRLTQKDALREIERLGGIPHDPIGDGD